MLMLRTILLFALCVFLGGCRGAARPGGEHRIYTTLPVFEFIAGDIAGSAYEVHSLLASGQSPHSYEPRPADVRSIEGSRLMIYGAPDLDGWLLGFGDVREVSLIELLPDSVLLPRGSDDPNPHFWLDPVAVRSLSTPLADMLCGIDAASCDTFRQNAADFQQALDSLHADVERRLDGRRQPVVASHPFLDYFAERYGIDVMNIVEGPGGLEPSPRELSRLISAATHADAAAVVTERGEASPAARAVSEAAGIPLVEIDPLGGGEGVESYADVIRSCVSGILRSRS